MEVGTMLGSIAAPAGRSNAAAAPNIADAI
jgi:hypothetical protein